MTLAAASTSPTAAAFYGLSLADLASYCHQRGWSQMHARTLFRQAYKAMNAAPWLDPGLPRALAAAAAQDFHCTVPTAAAIHRSGYDQSIKFVVALADGRQVETVLMPEKARLTLCLSSQVGCAQGCVFCHTGRMGLIRDLSAAEIIGQLLLAERWLKDHPEWLTAVRLPAGTRVSNLVFMGMGEPLDNPSAVLQALAIFTDPYGLGLGLSHISVSTAGHLPGIEALYAAFPKARLALSVHSPDETKRSRIMPINRRWPLGTVLSRLRELLGPDGPPVLLQYTLIAGVNDSLADAEGLAQLCHGLNLKINLIPLNAVGPSRLVAPEAAAIQSFRDVLHVAGLRVMVRYSKGQDIAAACGQLVAKGE